MGGLAELELFTLCAEGCQAAGFSAATGIHLTERMRGRESRAGVLRLQLAFPSGPALGDSTRGYLCDPTGEECGPTLRPHWARGSVLASGNG